MSKTINRLLLIAFSVVMVTWYGCKKETALSIPDEQAHFMNVSSGSYFITAPGMTYKIPLGLTTVSSAARTVNIAVSSPTGAVQGTHFTLNKTSFVIPAGKVIDTLVVSAVFSQYTTARKDTLVFTIQSTDKGGVASSTYNSVYKLFLRGPCAEVEINNVGALSEFLGAYTTNEVFGTSPYGPYTTTISSITAASPTTATATITNVYDDGWSPMTVTLDWTDLANRKVTFIAQNVGGNAGNTFGASFNGSPYAIRPASTGQVGTFSYCNKTLSFFGNIGVFGVGYSGSLYTVNMVKK